MFTMNRKAEDYYACAKKEIGDCQVLIKWRMAHIPYVPGGAADTSLTHHDTQEAQWYRNTIGLDYGIYLVYKCGIAGAQGRSVSNV